MSKNLSKIIIFAVLIALSIITIWPALMPGFFTHHDDLQVMRVFEMRKCFEDGQIPCRWVPDMGYGYGFPLFNYYSVLPYYIGGLLTYLVGFVEAAKILFIIPALVGGIFMYLLAKELFGKKAGVVAAVLFIFAPYRALDSFVRGAVAESFALSIIPLVFYASYRLIKEKNRLNFSLITFSWCAFLLCHNITTILFSPFLIGFILLNLYFQKFKNTLSVFLSLFWGGLLSAFFLLPAFLEKKDVQINSLTSGGFDFRIHFVAVWQLFTDRAWGYGASVWGTGDTISFQLGWPQWWMAIVLILLILVSFLKFKKLISLSNRQLSLAVFLIVSFGISIFMMHNKSAFVWEALPILQFAQFPWRFLSVSVFSLSLIGGFVIYLLPKKLQIITSLVVIALSVGLNYQYFVPASIYPLTDDQKLTGQNWEFQQKASITDYLPNTAKEPKSVAPASPVLVSGQGEVSVVNKKSNSFNFQANIQKQAKMEIPVFDFPNWTMYANGQQIAKFNDNNLGQISVVLPPGQYLVEGKFKNTLTRTIGNSISVLSLIGLLIFLFKFKNDKIH